MSVKPVNTSMSMTINPLISSSWHGITIQTKDELTSVFSLAPSLSLSFQPTSKVLRCHLGLRHASYRAFLPT